MKIFFYWMLIFILKMIVPKWGNVNHLESQTPAWHVKVIDLEKDNGTYCTCWIGGQAN